MLKLKLSLMIAAALAMATTMTQPAATQEALGSCGSRKVNGHWPARVAFGVSVPSNAARAVPSAASTPGPVSGRWTTADVPHQARETVHRMIWQAPSQPGIYLSSGLDTAGCLVDGSYIAALQIEGALQWPPRTIGWDAGRLARDPGNRAQPREKPSPTAHRSGAPRVRR